MREIYGYAQKGLDFKDAFEKVTAEWDVMEKLDFKKWMNFYQEDAHNKYKIAQLKSSLIDNGHGSFVPNVDVLRAGLPFRQPDMTPYSKVTNWDENSADVEQKQVEIKKKIQALIGRLSSAERIATNPDVQIALKKCIDMPLQEWLSMLQQLKREIQLAPMRASSASLLVDIVYKNANKIAAAGNRNAAVLLLKVAQVVPGVGMGGGLPAMNPVDVPMGGQPVAPEEDKDAIQEFLKNMNGDISSVDDDDDDEEEEDETATITVQAQAAPPEAVPAPAPEPEELAVTEDELAPPAAPAGPATAPIAAPEQGGGDVPDVIDLALENVKLTDVVARLEGIASLFKNRQIARQLSIVDLMMDKIGIAPFFPTLAEAMRSALESNQYCQSRVEEILAKLRGTMETPMSQGLENDQESSIQEHLAQQEVDEKARKDRRKALQNQEEDEALRGGPAPTEQVDAPAEMAGPAQVQTQPEAVRPVG